MSSDIRHPAGEFQPSRPREEHPGGPKHKPGVKASPADNVPESHAQAVPVGTAPRENLFQPRPNVEDMGGYDEGGASASQL
ncbi:uncharacterized protein TERG_04616 [Trichophyton rubrum CBS 118892]|uniref:Uncharacterized protein n=1 Tax=Trichophyton rubrum (strain ATCC MYA-4607 / CBS 118892) TaxID=559305 RepID=F2SNV5_TRIRC|nr:uncharacterized protein TERG_04616 [Trichophyton rubrum CBS 118892]EGD88366.1 hypothetical protein TERG_04616 [Trichophyton rubrum CBS 118892]